MRQSTGEPDQLLLTGGETAAAFPYRVVEARREGTDEIEQVHLFGRGLYLFLTDALRAEPDVLFQRAGEEIRIQQHDPEVPPQVEGIELAQIDAAEPDRAFLHIVEAEQQADDGGLARARVSD